MVARDSVIHGAEGAEAMLRLVPRAGSDCTVTSSTLTFRARQTSKSIQVPVLTDTITEGA